jgi:hypothetical protein
MAEMKMLDRIEQSDRPPNRKEKPESCYCSALPKGPAYAYPATRDGWPGRPRLVILETAQFRAQNDSLSLSPVHDGSSLHLNFRILAALSLGRPIFCPANGPPAGSGRVGQLHSDTLQTIMAANSSALFVPGPIIGAGLPGLILASVAFSAGGDGGRRAPEHRGALRITRALFQYVGRPGQLFLRCAD